MSNPNPAATPQPQPTGEGPRVLDLVLADLTDRAEVGREKYGTYLRAGNGRDALMDAYQEALDLCMYLRQAMMERDGVKVPEAPEPRFYPSQLTDFFARMRSIALTLDSDTNNPNSNDCATIAQDIERALGLSGDGEGHTAREVQTLVPPLFGVVLSEWRREAATTYRDLHRGRKGKDSWNGDKAWRRKVRSILLARGVRRRD